MKSTEELKKLRSKTQSELEKMLQEKYNKLKENNFSNKFGKLKKSDQISKDKKYIARIWTVISEKNKQQDNK